VTFRNRLVATVVTLVLALVVVLAVGVRGEMRRRLSAQYEQRVQALVRVLEDDVARDGETVRARLAALAAVIASDNRFRRAMQGDPGERAYLLDYAGGAMRLAGLALLQIQDSTGRILTSGHFRNAFDRLEPALPRLLTDAGGSALVEARMASGSFLALACVDSARVAERALTLVGGVALSPGALGRFAPDPELGVVLVHGRDTLLATGGGRRGRGADGAGRVVGEVSLPFVETDPDHESVDTARVEVWQSAGALDDLLRRVDRWFLVVGGVTGGAAVLLGLALSARISKPLTRLAAKTAEIDLDRLDVTFESDRADEIGALAHLLSAMVERLRASATRVREAERRATLGDLARQVNHDVKNGLAPLRNVLRHLSAVAHDRPEQLAGVFREREGTLSSSVSYLETLASNYARLSPVADRRPSDVNDIVRRVALDIQGGRTVELRLALAEMLPMVRTDPLVIRRILENLVGNAVESLVDGRGDVTVRTMVLEEPAAAVRIEVTDTGAGMSQAELDRAFEDFYTTKPSGTGLGLSVVRRLVMDLQGTLRVRTAPGAGTTFQIDLPVGPPD
jgi:two-component system nitrogen regulation sensor histidine kinase NtrY